MRPLLRAVEQLAGAGVEQALGQFGAEQGRLGRVALDAGRAPTRCRRAGRRRRRSASGRRARRPWRGRRSGCCRSRRAGRRRCARRSARAARLRRRSGRPPAAPPRRSSRICSSSEPWPAAGVIDSAGIGKAISSARPSRRSPATASTIASSSPSASLRSRVSTLPCSSLTSRSGRAASSCARRRRLAVPTLAPSGTSSSEDPTPIQASARILPRRHRGQHQPLGQLRRQVLGRVDPDLRLAIEQRPLDPPHEPRLVPSSTVGRTSTSSAPPSISATCPAWARASVLPRVAIRSIRACGESIPVGVERLVLFRHALAASAGTSPPKKLSGTPAGIALRNSVTFECPPRPPARSRRPARTARATR